MSGIDLSKKRTANYTSLLNWPDYLASCLLTNEANNRLLGQGVHLAVELKSYY